MLHYMKLQQNPFDKIKCGMKTIELRLNDEKRQCISVNDIIVFTNIANQNQTIRVKVVNLYNYPSFDELYKELPLDKCGYLPDELLSASSKDMEVYYSAEEQELYGVLGIEIELL